MLLVLVVAVGAVVLVWEMLVPMLLVSMVVSVVVLLVPVVFVNGKVLV